MGEDIEDLLASNAAVSEDADGAGETREEPTCGLSDWRPAWLQRCAKASVYAGALGLLGFSNRATRAYFFGTLSTIEKRFAIPSRTAGLISSVFELGVLVGVAFLGYIGHRLHGPKTVATGAALIACACMLIVSPHIVLGPGGDVRAFPRTDAAAEEAHARSLEDVATGLVPRAERSSPEGDAALCGLPAAPHCEAAGGGGGGEGDAPAATGILLSGLFLDGLGESAQLTVGLAYLDNNAHKNKAPLLLAASQVIEMFGNLVGSFLASFSLSKYVDPTVTPPFDEHHPRWIGAWWIGWPFLSMLMLITAIPILMFPRVLPCAARRRRERGEESPKSGRPSTRDFGNALKRMFKNKILVLNILSAIFLMTAYVGFGTFMPKYIETQYRTSASYASLVSGWVGLLAVGFGILGSGVVIAYFKPSARSVAAWNVLVELFDASAHFSWAFLHCANMDLSGHRNADESWNLTETCNAGCGCSPDMTYFPVCSTDGSTSFYSPCHAGCSSFQSFHNGTTMYTGCTCTYDGLARKGACPGDCFSNFYIFIVMRLLMTLLGASGRAGNVFVVFRSVSEEDKSLSIAIGEIFVCTLAYFPAPNLFGALVDSTCILWDNSCGRQGNCWLYDDHKMRYILNFTAGGCLVVGALLDAGVWFYSAGVQMYEDGPPDEMELETRNKTESRVEIWRPKAEDEERRPNGAVKEKAEEWRTKERVEERRPNGIVEEVKTKETVEDRRPKETEGEKKVVVATVEAVVETADINPQDTSLHCHDNGIKVTPD